MSLLNNYLSIVLTWACCFFKSSTFRRSILHAIACLTEGQRKTISHNIRMLHAENEDFSSHYKLYSRDQWDSQALFAPMIKQSGSFADEDYIALVGDFTTIRKTGKKIPFTAPCRDPMSPKYHPNLIWGMICLQMSFIAPLYRKGDFPARSLPIQWKVLPRMPKPKINDSEETWEKYKAFQKKNNRSRFFVAQLKNLRQSMDEGGWSHKELLISLDGDFCNRIILNERRDRTELILRARKNIKLCFQATNEGRRFYSIQKFTPEETRQDDKISWKACTIYHGGEWRKVEYKEVDKVYWQTGAKKQALKLLVLRPISYRRTKSGKLLYRQPAYLLTTDLRRGSEKLIQAYFDRWEIEVNHKEEKHILGVGQAQVRNKKSIDKQTGLVVASYSALLLASITGGNLERQDEMKTKSKWYSKAKRPSCNSLRKQLLKELDMGREDLETLFWNILEPPRAA
jgi:hypothetical protein